MKDLILINMWLPFLLGTLISVTIRWISFLKDKRKILESRDRSTYRMVLVDSSRTLYLALGKRYRRVLSVIPEISKDTRRINKEKVYHVFGEKEWCLDKISELKEQDCECIFQFFQEKGLNIYLIPNEDIACHPQPDMLNDALHYFCNDEIKRPRLKQSKAEKQKVMERLMERKIEEERQLWNEMEKIDI